MIDCKSLLFIGIFIIYSCQKDNETKEQPLIITDEIMLYSSNPKGYNELYKLENNESSIILSDPNYDFWWPKVSPDKNKMLVYRSPINSEKNHDDYSNATLMIYDIDGTNPQILIEKGQFGWNAHGTARWNEDGSKILMIAEQQFPGGKQWRMVITQADGKNPKNLSDWWILDPNYSRDNEYIVFMAFPNNKLTFDLSKLELHRARYNDSDNTINEIERLTNNTTRDHDPSYSPDGNNIVYSGGNVLYTNVDIVVYDLALGEEQKVADDGAANGGSMCWSLDGESIYFHSLNLFSYPFRIKKVDVNNKSLSTILRNDDNDYGFFHPEIY